MTFATYNIHKCRGLDGRVSVARIAAVMRRAQVDIWAVQEVLAAQAAELADRLGLHHAFGHARDHRGQPYGNATFASDPFPVRTIDLTSAGREPRIALRTDLHLGAQVLHVFNLHLGTSHGERRQQAERLLTRDLLHALDVIGPRVVLGDFNEWTHGQVSRCLRREFAGCCRPRGFPGWLPTLALDHIYWDASLSGTSARALRHWPALVASDHVPLAVNLHLARR